MSKTTSCLECYLEIVGHKRLKRTPDEINRGLDAEAAAKERLENQDTAPTRNSGKFTIQCTPQPGVDPDFLESLTGSVLEIDLDQQWYSWFEEQLSSPYNGDKKRLMQDILNMGMGEVLVSIQRPEDLA